MSGVERPDRVAANHTVTVDDIRELTGGATPHFALQIRDRIRRLIADLPPDDPVRLVGEREIARLERMAWEGQASGPVQEHEVPLPSLRLPREAAERQ
jgi:hypothetical protein